MFSLAGHFRRRSMIFRYQFCPELVFKTDTVRLSVSSPANIIGKTVLLTFFKCVYHVTGSRVSRSHRDDDYYCCGPMSAEKRSSVRSVW